MKNTKSLLVIVSAAILLLLATVTLIPTNIREKDCLLKSGTVASIFEAGANDAVIKLNGNSDNYYINRGLEKFTMNELQSKIGNEVTIFYVKPSRSASLLSSGNASIQILKIISEGKILYSEI